MEAIKGGLGTDTSGLSGLGVEGGGTAPDGSEGRLRGARALDSTWWTSTPPCSMVVMVMTSRDG